MNALLRRDELRRLWILDVAIKTKRVNPRTRLIIYANPLRLRGMNGVGVSEGKCEALVKGIGRISCRSWGAAEHSSVWDRLI